MRKVSSALPDWS